MSLVDCPDCNGSGEALDFVNFWGEAETEPCWLCEGTGALHPAEIEACEGSRS